MAKGANQKLKLLYLTKIFSEQTDEEHGLSLVQIIKYLESYDVSADRKTLYLDFEELRRFGLDIQSYQEGRSVLYNLASREFELAELKLLVDSVQSAKFITEKKSRALIKKLEGLVSHNDAQKLHREVKLAERVKTINESIYYNVDRIHSAISSDSKIEFNYYQWNEKKEMVLRHDGAKYSISPWALVWDDENYYLVGYDSKDGIIKHYRVDKMLKLNITGEKREGEEIYRKTNIAKYSKGLFGMFGGESMKVSLECENGFAGIIIDRFGKDPIFTPIDEDHFATTVEVQLSDQFLGWIISLGGAVKVTGPELAVDKMKVLAKKVAEQYL